MAVVTLSLAELIGRTKLGKERIVEGLNSIGAPVDNESDGELFVEVTPNRPDFYSVEGVARALSSYYGAPCRQYTAKKSPYAVNVEASVAKVRPCIVAALVKNVKMNDETIKSLIQLQEKLHETIGRKRKKVAIGIHNADVIKFPLTYKGVNDEKFVPLDFDREMTIKQILEEHPKGKAYAHLVSKVYPMLYDQEGVVSFPPIINGERTRVSENTTNLFIDITGTHQKTIEGALNIIVCALADRGAEIYRLKVGDSFFPNLEPAKMKLDFEGICRLLGEDFSKKQIFQYLERMGWSTEADAALVPPYRLDVWHYADAAEDVAIAYGYNKFKPTLPSFFTAGDLTYEHEDFKQAMVGMGFVECVNSMLTNKEKIDGKSALKINNPKTTDFTVVRLRVVDTLLDNLVLNKTHELPIKIFEIGQVYDKGERTHFAFAISAETLDFSVLKGVLQSLVVSVGMDLKLEKIENKLFIKGRGAGISHDGKMIGFIGEVAPERLKEIGFENPVGVCEFEL